ncbi:MAG: hypothetical protein KDB98_08265 [Flavobacteriales bacterium]|nr:hypothetical protein [Flavobacteriales bacterium]
MKELIYISSFIVFTSGFSDSVVGQNSNDSISVDDCEKVFAFATEMPKYPDGEKAAIAEMNAVVNRVTCRASAARYLSFVVTAEGKVTSPVFQPGNLKACSEVLEREFRSLPLWIPAKQTGKPVCVNVIIPLK